MSLPPMDWNHKIMIADKLKGFCTVCGDKDNCENVDCNIYQIKKDLLAVIKDFETPFEELYKEEYEQQKQDLENPIQ